MRWRWRAKWAGTAASVAVGILWISSVFGLGGVFYVQGRRFWAVDVERGGVALKRGTTNAANGLQYYQRKDSDLIWCWWPGRYTPWSGYLLPFWIPFAFIAAPTLWLWRRDRRAPGSCIQCGYDRTGTPGVCPECGAGP